MIGTSVLTNGATEKERQLLRRTASSTETGLESADATSIRALFAQPRRSLVECDGTMAARASAELKEIVQQDIPSRSLATRERANPSAGALPIHERAGKSPVARPEVSEGETPRATHEADAWSNKDAQRLFRSFRADVLHVLGLGRQL